MVGTAREAAPWIVDDELPRLTGRAEFPVAVMDEAGRLTWMSSALRSMLGEPTTECLLTGSGGGAGPSEVRSAAVSILRAAHRLEVVAAWLCGQLG